MEITYTEDQLIDVAKELFAALPSKIVCFHGEMGAGKTTLIKAMVKALGSAGEASSPTFGIVNEYQDENENILAYHFDFYRLNDENEAYDLGIEDYFNSEAWIFMEWAERVSNILPEDTIEISLSIVDKITRTLVLPD